MTEDLDHAIKQQIISMILKYRNMTNAAIALNMSRRTIYRYLEKWKIKTETILAPGFDVVKFLEK